MPNLLLWYWSSQLFGLRVALSTDIPVLLLNQPIFLNSTLCVFKKYTCFTQSQDINVAKKQKNKCINDGQTTLYCRKNLVEAHGWLLFLKTHMCVPSSFTSWWITWSKLSSGSSLGTGMLDVPDRVNLWDDVCKSVWNFERKW